MYLHQSLYGQHLERWLEAFGRRNVLVVFQEEIADDPQGNAAVLYTFLGVSPDFRSDFLDRRANENVVYRSHAIGALYKAIGDTARVAGLGGAIAWAKRTRRLSTIWSVAKENVRDRVPPMRSETAEMLCALLGPEMKNLVELLGGRELPWPRWRAAQVEAA
jgi:hypothetical protein